MNTLASSTVTDLQSSPSPMSAARRPRKPFATGNWAADNALGRAFADEIVAFMRDHNCPNFLGATVKGMMESGAYGGVEVGFFHRLAELSVRGSPC